MFSETATNSKTALRFAVPLYGAIFIFSIVELGLSAAYGTQLADAPLDERKLKFAHIQRRSAA